MKKTILWTAPVVLALCTMTMAAQATPVSMETAATSTDGAGQSSAPVKDDLFAGTEIFAKGANDITEVTMNPDTLGMVDGKDSKKAHNMVLNVVRTYTYDKPGMFRIEDVDAFRNKLNSSDWFCSVHTRSLKTGDSTDVCNKRRTDDMVETAIISVSPRSLSFIHIIRKKYSGESRVEGSALWPDSFGYGIDPSLRADRAINTAELKAQVAEMRSLSSATLPMLANLKVPDIKLSVDSSLKGLLDDNVRFKIDDEVQRQVDKAQEGQKKQKQPE